MNIPNLKSLQKIFFDEKECIKFLIEENIICKPEKCQFCNNEMYLYLKVNIFCCKNTNCKKMITVFKNTFFSQHRLKCNDILLIGYFWIHKLKIQQIHKITNIARLSIRNFIKDFRRLAINSLTPEDFIVGGSKVIVEIDESLFDDFWIVGGIERTKERKMFFVVVDNRNTETLTRIIKQHVKPGSTIYTDAWRGYQNLESLGMKHIRTNHSRPNPRQRIRKIHTNTIEGIWNLLKIFIPKFKRRRNIIEPLLKEFIWREKHKNNLWRAFLNNLKNEC